MIDFSVIRWRFSDTSFWIIFFGVFQRYAVHFSWFSSNLLSTIFSLLYLLHFFNYIRVEYLAWLSIQKHAGISLMLVNQLCVTFWSFALIFLFCNFGEKIGGQFNKLNDVIYQCNWYLCPLKTQQMFPMILTATQNVPTMTSFGNVVCSRESFKKVTLIYFQADIFVQIFNWIDSFRRWLRADFHATWCFGSFSIGLLLNPFELFDYLCEYNKMIRLWRH